MPPNLKHDLRTPLNHILGYCEMLIEQAQDEKQEALLADLQRIHMAGRRLLVVINDIFDSARLSEEKLDERLIQHELRTPLNHIIGYAEMLQEEAEERRQVGFIPDLQKIHDAARNLLGLVVEHLTPAQFADANSNSSAAASATTFIRREAVVVIETSFVKGPDQTRPGRGSILVVDDDALNREMLARRLERLGHSVVCAEHGREAIEKLGAGQFDLLLLDIIMPVMSGYEVLEQVKANSALRNLPVIVLSASDQADRIAQCIAMGAEDYLPKPFDPVLLQARIGASLEKKRLRDQEALYLRQIEEEKKRSDDLLHIILPADVAAELKETEGVRPRRHENVGVLFCDIVGFTAYCEPRQPEEILMHLQALVEAFEQLVPLYGLEKVKTIGDSFMATAGLLTAVENPALACIRCGIAMIATAQAAPPHWQVRVGVHVGPVIAGVVGRRKYQYDVWGDTVNTAARLEQVSVPNSVCVNADTAKLLQSACRLEPQGRAYLKGKGEQEVFAVRDLF